MNQSVRKMVAPAALLFGFGATAAAVDVLRDPVPPLGAQAAQSAVESPHNLASAFRAASRAALPGVVYVQVQAAPRTVSQIPDQYRGTPFEQFFRGPGGPGGAVRPQMGSGSGFVISPDGYVLTNNHVVENTSRVTVVLTDKREFDATVVGRDPNTDVAVLKIEGKNLPTVQLGQSDGLQTGDWVLALGYPMSVGETVTAGIVSAKGKSLGILQQSREADAPLEHFIQTDAAINPGNSGGPLVDLNGRVVGMNTAIASPTGAYAGYGFAVPIELAKRVADDLIRHGAVHRPKLGVQIRDVAPADVEVFGLANARGAVVASTPQGPAQQAGIRLGDVIVAVDGAPTQDTGDLMEKVARRQPGERVVLDLVRYGKRERVTVQLGTFESAARTARASGARAQPSATSRLGLEVAEVTPALARQLGVKHTSGVVITAVDPMGPAPQALTGLRIDRLNGQQIGSLRDLQNVASRLEAGSTVSIVGRTAEGDDTIINYRLRR